MIKVFLVEDEVVMRNGIKNNIPWEQEGFEFVGEASDGELAYPLIKREKPDILITDIRMPFMDGLELSRLVKKELPQIKIIILSGYNEFDYAKTAISIGVTDYLLKPISSAKLLEAVKKAGYEPGKDFKIAMDAASSEWKTGKKGEYRLPKAGTVYTSEELIEHWKKLVEKYPIISIEDALDEEDWEGWQKLTKELGDKVQLVGDDLFVTNTERLAKGISLGCGNSILIKLNQIGSVSETLEAIKMAHKAGYTAISSHRSGETEDTTIADLAVALNTCQIKTGAPSRTERVAKYNQLLRIEEELGASAVYPGMKAFNVKQG